MMHLTQLALVLMVAAPAPALERAPKKPYRLMNNTPERVIRLEKRGRFPASVEQERQELSATNQELDKSLPIGVYAIVHNSVEEWNNQVVRVTARYDDGSRQVQLDNRSFARVSFANLHTLSPETDRCCSSNGVDVCRGDKVWHPLPTSSIGVPEGTVKRIFRNCSVIVRDGLDYVYEARQIGKAVDCAPQKASVCVGKTVFVDGYRNGTRYQVEGPVTHVFTNGTALVKTGLWLLPADSASLIVQTDRLPSAQNRSPASAVITHRDGQHEIPTPVYPEIEPFDSGDAQRLINRRSITVPLR